MSQIKNSIQLQFSKNDFCILFKLKLLEKLFNT